MKCHSKVGRKVCGQNVTDFGTKYYSETVCHTVTNRPNLPGWNVTADGLSGGRIVWVEMSRGWFVGGRIVNAPICFRFANRVYCFASERN